MKTTIPFGKRRISIPKTESRNRPIKEQSVRTAKIGGDLDELVAPTNRMTGNALARNTLDALHEGVCTWNSEIVLADAARSKTSA